MGKRGKVVLARINDESKRRATLAKRKPGLVKKVREIAMLCDAEAAVVVYSPGDNQPTVWPSTSEARATVSKFFSRPEADRMANSHTAKSFTEEKCNKKKNKAQRLITMNEERNTQSLITSIYAGKTRIQVLDTEQKKKLSDFADKKKEELLKHIQRLKGKEKQAPHPPQALPPVLQMPPESQEASGLNINGLAGARNSPSPAATTHCQLMNVRGVNRFDMTGRAASGLNMNGLAAGRNIASPAAGHGQQMNLRGMTRVATLPLPLPATNPLVMSPNYSTGNRLNMTGLHGQTNLGDMMQHPLPSPLFMPPTSPFTMPIQAPYPSQEPPLVLQLPQISQAATGLNINGFAGCRNFSSPASVAHGQLNVQGMTLLASTLGLSLPTPDAIVMSPNNSAANRLDMTGRFYGQTNIGGMMQQHPLPYPANSPPNQVALSNVQSMASGLYTTYNGFINASTRTMTGDGNFGERIQHASPPYLPLELPRRLGLPPMPPIQYDAIGVNKISNENRWTTIVFPTPGTTSLDQSSFGDEYRWDSNEFPAPATAALNQTNFGDGTSNGGWDDLDTALEADIVPYWWR